MTGPIEQFLAGPEGNLSRGDKMHSGREFPTCKYQSSGTSMQMPLESRADWTWRSWLARVVLVVILIADTTRGMITQGCF